MDGEKMNLEQTLLLLNIRDSRPTHENFMRIISMNIRPQLSDETIAMLEKCGFNLVPPRRRGSGRYA